MKFRVSGHDLELDPGAARARLAAHPPEPLQVHWVDHDGKRWPPKQALEIISGLRRASYTAHQALSVLRRLGFETSEWRGTTKADLSTDVAGMTRVELLESDEATRRERLHEAVEVLADFMGSQGLTTRIATLEHQLVGASQSDVAAIVEGSEISRDTLAAALAVRVTLGRINDVVHATVIALTLPLILEAGETVSNRPSLAAGNDPSRPFDLETTQRVAEFKVSVWRGADAMRKRGAFADLVHLALDESGRKKQLFVVGRGPIDFLAKTTSPASWGLNRSSPKLREKFVERFGPLDVAIRDFKAGPGAEVEVVDLAQLLPGLEEWISGNGVAQEMEAT